MPRNEKINVTTSLIFFLGLLQLSLGFFLMYRNWMDILEEKMVYFNTNFTCFLQEWSSK